MHTLRTLKIGDPEAPDVEFEIESDQSGKTVTVLMTDYQYGNDDNKAVCTLSSFLSAAEARHLARLLIDASEQYDD